MGPLGAGNKDSYGTFSSSEASNMQLAIPGKYRPGADVVRIAKFVPDLVVISSKQRCGRLFVYFGIFFFAIVDIGGRD